MLPYDDQDEDLDLEGMREATRRDRLGALHTGRTPQAPRTGPMEPRKNKRPVSPEACAALRAAKAREGLRPIAIRAGSSEVSLEVALGGGALCEDACLRIERAMLGGGS